MRKFKHKKLGCIAEFNPSGANYILNENRQTPMQLPSWAVEDSNDWQEVKEEFPKIISFRNKCNNVTFNLCENGKYSSTNSSGYFPKEHHLKLDHFEIYQVAVSETEVFTLGDKVKHPFNDSFDVISKFIICNDPKRDVVWTLDKPDMIGKIVANVGNYFGNCNIEVSRLEKLRQQKNKLSPMSSRFNTLHLFS